MFDRVPVMALTASATKEWVLAGCVYQAFYPDGLVFRVREDIIHTLDMNLDRLYHVIHCKLGSTCAITATDRNIGAPSAFNRVVCAQNVMNIAGTFRDLTSTSESVL
jgi:hypothetical protein